LHVHVSAADPGAPTPHPQPAIGVIGWTVRSQWPRLLLGGLITFAFLGAQQCMPYVIGRAIDDGVAAGDGGAVLRWSAVLAACIALATVTGIGSYVYATTAGMDTEFRIHRYLVGMIVRGGAKLLDRTEAGELVAIATADARPLYVFSTQVGRLIASVLTFLAAFAMLAALSWWFVLAVGIGVAVMFVGLRPIFQRLEVRGGVVRNRVRRQIAISTDTVAGLRVIRGIGGEAYFLERYRRASEETRLAGIDVGRTTALPELVRLVLPGLLLVGVLWLGAELTVSGAMTAGEFVMLFGYVVALTRPLQYVIQGINVLTRAVVVASKRLAALQPATSAGPADAVATIEPSWPARAVLTDHKTGLVVEPGRLTGVAVSDGVDVDHLLQRLSGNDPEGSVQIGPHSLREFGAATVRSHMHVMESRSHLFSGVLRDQLDVDGRRSDADIMSAIHTASAVDIVGVDPSRLDDDTVPETGYDLSLVVGERGRNFSGGERQRLILARALLADPEILILDDPTSACDAQTEARIARRLARHRSGATTVIVSRSPQLLAVCDQVIFLAETATLGDHASLLGLPAYQAALTR
jgi:ABC-type multidrug transport system fused ATPase/permease subunit